MRCEYEEKSKEEKKKDEEIIVFKQKTAYEVLRGLMGSEMCMSKGPYTFTIQDEEVFVMWMVRMKRIILVFERVYEIENNTY